MQIKFSVVIPLYNKEKEIKEAIESVLYQTYPADEIIVVDDGSTDKSAEIVEKYFENKVTLIRQKNQGVSAARNKGIKTAKNEFICLLDADDLWEKNFLKEIYYLIKKFPNAIFYSTSYKILDECGDIYYSKIPYNKNFVGVIDNFFKIFKNYYGIIHSSSVCIKKSSNIFFPEKEKKGEDICTWIELALKGKLAFSAKSLVIYRLNASNRSNQIHKEAIIPCQLKWIYRNKSNVTKDIIKFVHKNILITVYGGFAFEENYENIKAIIEYMKENKDRYRYYLYPALFCPKILLKILRKIRRL